MKLPIEKLRNYFQTKVQLASSIDQAYYGLKGFTEASNKAPFIVIKGTTISALDFLGRPTRLRNDLKKVEIKNKSTSVNVMDTTKFDDESGTITL